MKLHQCLRVLDTFVMGRLLVDAEILRSPCERRGLLQLVAQNTRLDASVIKTIVAKTLLPCSMKCSDDLFCTPINYNAKAKHVRSYLEAD